ncbi:BadF/BadG/BcrA/BcrD ATPase family protein [Fundidesulfovibrio agrisoli]|uniref:BadF/BadG/BcrA/BcrD ATPase family protein n=1 Tax=Fundidesulfovibrio agrisoli TaxID=2922717 RepID=UPI001FAB5A9D|nr:BadF/BadG/BcrA/BcrD ATPase family protein [Fundidesulfovibrio agrisoli]
MPRAPRDAIGLCLGASSISFALVCAEADGVRLARGGSVPHNGDPASTLLSVLESIPNWRELPLAATGRRLRAMVSLPSLSEPEAVELAAAHALGGAGAVTVLSVGGETFMAYGLDAHGKVRSIQSGNKCASGTGEFLLQQLGRMGLAVEDLSSMDHAAEPHAVSGRCSVFCKSDCTHALNKGAHRQEVVAGLGRMMAGKCLELLTRMPVQRVLLAGGCAANPYLLRFLREELPGLEAPENAAWFEATGAALWALDHAGPVGGAKIFAPREGSFVRLGPLSEALPLVEFKEHPRGRAREGDVVLVGLDVGSTTTKGVVVRRGDRGVLAGEYLRTEGDPVGASRRVYASLAAQLGAPVRIVGLGVTGSGRAIAALHASATAAINEIVAHAAAALHYDPAVDTIFEIGGQDAKYTSLSAGRPCDSAMNEACSAGTGSFLEESARESLGVPTDAIAELALAAGSTPNFNDQCAAFIGSDIKLAVQEGLPLEDILAGLVHSVCLNYVSRVMGSRPVGERVFMQGGVCYNRAVPAAMAMLTGKRVVVPPDPGLMGALGVALEVEARIARGLLAQGTFDLDELAAREARQREPFTCRGGKGGQHGCDRGCRIARIEVGGTVHPFGGICNRFENLRQGRSPDAAALDLVMARHRRVFRSLEPPAQGRQVVGLNRSYLVNTYFPLFDAFFKELGYGVLLPERADPEGVKRRGAALCYPGELAHGFMADLLARKPEAVFLPHISGVPGEPGQATSCTCVLLQGEPFYLSSAFGELAAYGPRLLRPTLDFTRGLEAAEKAMLGAARGLGADARTARRAFAAGVEAQRACRADLEQMGREALERLEQGDGAVPGVVLFGRAYNAFAPEANKAVPEKLATRGAMVIPCDILPLPPGLRPEPSVYWGQGRVILQAAQAVRRHPGLYGAYVTNFSCGPDSFLLGYFRDEMGAKPSLTLELDSHTADAGLETRLEAFLDIAASHRRGNGTGRAAPAQGSAPLSTPKAGCVLEANSGRPGVVDSQGRWLPLTHERVRLALPSMNPYGTALAARALEGMGIRCVGLPPADEEALKRGRGNSSCKECLPLQLTVGTLLDYLEKRPDGEVTAYFMPGAQGPCRFGQYNEFTARMLARRGIPDAVVLTPLADTGYAGLSNSATLGIWRGLVLGDFLDEVRAVLLAAARDPREAEAEFEKELGAMLQAMGLPWKRALARLGESAGRLARIPLRLPAMETPTVSLLGEIFVRNDPISRQRLVERLAAKGIAARTAPVHEWVFYTDWLQNEGHTAPPGIGGRIRQWVKRRAYRQIRAALAPSGLVRGHTPDIPALVRAGRRFLTPALTGEAILTVGGAFHEMLAPACGIVSIGPFGCMPARLSEALLADAFNTTTLAELYPERVRALPESELGSLPFLALETDGNPFPQLIEARLEAFCLQALRLHEAALKRPQRAP